MKLTGKDRASLKAAGKAVAADRHRGAVWPYIGLFWRGDKESFNVLELGAQYDLSENFSVEGFKEELPDNGAIDLYLYEKRDGSELICNMLVKIRGGKFMTAHEDRIDGPVKYDFRKTDTSVLQRITARLES